MPVSWSYIPPAVNALELLQAVRPEAEKLGAEALLAASQPLVPVDTGTLLGTGRVEADGTGAAVVYDAVSKDDYAYGIRQHEDLSLHHPNGGQGKFLEQPMNAEHDAIAAAMLIPLKALLE